MSKTVAALGICITLVAIVGVSLYTNIFELARPTFETSINSTKDVVSKVQGKDLVSKAEQIASDVKNITSQIKVQNPLEPKK